MYKPCIFADQCIHFDIISSLRENEYDITTAHQVGRSADSDFEIFDYAVSKKMVLLTNDRGFGNMAYFDIKMSPGVVIVIVTKMSKKTIINNVISFFDKHTKQDINGGLFIIEAGRTREIRR